MKRVLAVILAVIMAISPISIAEYTYADPGDGIIFYFDNASASTGSGFKVNLQVENNGESFNYVTVVNLLTTFKACGCQITNVYAGSLADGAKFEIAPNFDSITVSEKTMSSDGVLAVVELTAPTNPGVFDLYPAVNGVEGPSSPRYDVRLSNITVKSGTSSYKVTYNANEGNGAPDQQTKNPGEPVTLSTTKPTRNGYIFLGWATSTYSDVAYQPGDVYSVDSDVVLYAKWLEKSFDIFFDGNGGSTPDKGMKQYGIPYTIPSMIPTRSGDTFVGWATSRDGEVQYHPGDVYNEDAEIVFYAIWTEKTLAVKYDLNYENAPKIESSYGKSNTTIKLTSVIPEREGYDFVGWSTKPDGVKEYGANDNYNIGTGNDTLYALWELKNYTITYDANEGEEAPASSIKTHSIDILLPLDIPTREGYDFQGWAEEKDAEEVKYAPGDTFSDNGDKTLYAIWKLKEYTISFDANGGTAAPQSVTKTHSEEITLPTDKLTRPRFLFLGWSTTKNATTATYAAGDKYTEEGDVTLYAVWKEAVYTIKFDANGGKGGLTSLTKEGGKDLVLSFTDKQLPTRDGYFLLGWSSSKSATDPTYVVVYDQVFKTDADTTLYAVWTPNPFKDMTKVKWYTRYIGYLYANGVMIGLKKTSFGYDGEFTRGQLVTILYRIAGQPEVKTKKSPFKDVTKASAYYYNAVLWAKENNIVDGYKTGNFGPNDPIKRQDFMKVLYSYTKEYLKKNVSVKDANAYKEKSDASKVSKYAVEMVNWGYVNGFIGSGSGLSPKGTALRNDAATIIARFMVKYDL